MIDLKSTHVYREIHEQPYVLERLLNEERGPVEALAAEIKRRDIRIHRHRRALHQRHNVPRYAQYLLGAMKWAVRRPCHAELVHHLRRAAPVRERTCLLRHQSKRQKPGHRRRPR